MELLSAHVVDALRDEISRGELAGGQRLKEDALAERFGVSRVPIREALRQLEREGFVVIQRFKGAAVSARSREDVVELMQVRRGLESLAASLAAERRGGSAADGLRQAIRLSARPEGEAGADDVPQFMEFHAIVARAAGNGHLAAMLQDVTAKIAWGFKLEIDHRIQSSWSDHLAIAEAILAGSPTTAAYLMDRHVLKNESFYRHTFGIFADGRQGPSASEDASGRHQTA